MQIGLCEGRHEIKTNEGEDLDDFVFSAVENPMDFRSHYLQGMEWLDQKSPSEIHLYVTGLTTLLTAFLLAVKDYGDLSLLILMHYDRDSGNYLPQAATTLC
jgi:hypothetical protein